MKRMFTLLLAVVMTFSLIACGNQSQGGETKPSGDVATTRTITDSQNRTVEIPAEVKSIVCVGVGALRYTCYMDAEDLVIGVEDYEVKADMTRLYNYINFSKFKDLPVIGTNGQPYTEEIIKLSPDVIVMSKSASVEADVLQNQTGTPVVVVPGSDGTLDENAYKTIGIMGQLYNKQERADELTAYLKGVEKDLSDRTKDIPEESKPTVYVGGVSFKGHHGFEGTEAGYGPFSLIGAKNLADTTGQTGAFNIDLEQVLSWDPDVIFVDFNGMNLIKEDYAKNAAYYDSLKAVQEGRFIPKFPSVPVPLTWKPLWQMLTMPLAFSIPNSLMTSTRL